MRSVLAVVLLLAPLASADEVVLKSGGVLDGEVVEESADFVRLRMSSGELVVPRSKIAQIRREDRASFLLREARARRRAGSLGRAVEIYERIYDGRDATVRDELAATLARHADELLGAFRLDEARRALARLAELAPRHEALARLHTRLAREDERTRRLYERAREAAQGEDFRAALALLEEFRQRRPVDDPVARAAVAACHEGAADADARAGRLRQALDHFRAAETYGAKGAARPIYLLQPIAVLESLREGDVAAARRQLARIRTTYPHPSVPLFLRAVVSHVTGDVDAAVRDYAAAAKRAETEPGDRPGVDYESVKRYATATMRSAIAHPPREGARRWRETFLAPLTRREGEHFVVYAPTAKSAAEVAAAADAAYERIARDLTGGVPGEPRAEIVVHASRQAYLAADPAPAGTPLAGVVLARGQTGGVCYVTLDERGERLVRVETHAGPRLHSDTLPHELVHVVQRRGLDVFRRGHWLDEGLATLYESAAGQADRARLWRTLKQARIPLPELLELRSTPPDKVAVFYVEAHALTSFLRSLGDEEDWRRFLRLFAQGEFAAAVKGAYGIASVEELERRWLAQSS